MRLTAATAGWGLAALLAAAAGTELAWPRPAAPPPPPPPPVGAAAPAASAEPVAAWARLILDRPVFNPERKPDAPDATPTPAQAGRSEPPRLAGIMVTPGGRRAIFAAAGESGPATVAAEGAKIGVWKVQAIGAGEVQLTSADGARTVRPHFSDLPPAAPPLPSPLANNLLPPLPPFDNRPFASQQQPSGAAIFANAPAFPGPAQGLAQGFAQAPPKATR